MEFVVPELENRYFWSVIDNASFGFAYITFFSSWIKNEFAKVVCESRFVCLETFLWSIFSSVVDIDANWSGKLSTQTDWFDFGESESST